jgi:hypothetical protein
VSHVRPWLRLIHQSVCAGSRKEVCTPSVNAELSNGYFEVRELEVKLVSLFKPTILDNLDHNHDLAELWSVICNPSLYDKPRSSNLPKWSALVSKLEEL